jgi:hypothetical protein
MELFEPSDRIALQQTKLFYAALQSHAPLLLVFYSFRDEYKNTGFEFTVARIMFVVLDKLFSYRDISIHFHSLNVLRSLLLAGMADIYVVIVSHSWKILW